MKFPKGLNYDKAKTWVLGEFWVIFKLWNYLLSNELCITVLLSVPLKLPFQPPLTTGPH